jgi:hypothetical protein
MPTIDGKLESVKKIFGWDKDLKIVVNGVTYHKRSWPNGEKKSPIYDINILTSRIGKQIKVDYEDTKTKFIDLIAERILPISWCVPRKHKEITGLDYS